MVLHKSLQRLASSLTITLHDYPALISQGHDVTRTPNDWMPFDASIVLAQQYPQHGGIILAAQNSWSLAELIAALDCLLSETEAADWIGQVRWLNQWRK